MADIKHAREAIFQTVDAMEMLLKAARVRTGTATLRPERVDLNELIHCVARMFEREARSKGLTLALNVAADSYCQGDRRLLMLILHNPVGNAVKYSDNGTIRISARACDDGACTLRVADEGPGIAPEHQRRIFEEFARGPTQGHPGAGLGLAIAARAAKLLGADLSVESSPGVGSVFRLNCPKTSD
jgi:signal transduction histidine kinase